MYKSQIKDVLMDRGYPERFADVVSGELLVVDETLLSGLSVWLENGTETDYSSHGYTLSGLMKSRGLTYPAALLTMDWLIKEPDVAVKALEKRKY